VSSLQRNVLEESRSAAAGTGTAHLDALGSPNPERQNPRT